MFFSTVPDFANKLRRFSAVIERTDPPLTGAHLLACKDVESFNEFFVDVEPIVRPIVSSQFDAILHALAPLRAGALVCASSVAISNTTFLHHLPCLPTRSIPR